MDEDVFHRDVTPLHIACGFDSEIVPDFDTVKQAIDQDPASVNACTVNECYSALHPAASSGSLEIVELLLQHGAFINDKAERGGTPLGIAVQNGHERVVACLIDLMQSNGMTNEDIVGYDSYHHSTLFHLAASNSHVGVLKWLFERLGRSYLEAKDGLGVTLLLAACEWNGRDMFTGELLWRQERADMFEFLLHEGANPLIKDSGGKTILHYLATFRNGTISIAAEMLRRGVDIHAQSNATQEEDDSFSGPGSTALHVACKSWDTDMIQFLLLKEADPKVQDDDQRTPLHLVASRREDPYTSFKSPDTRPITAATLLLDAAPEIIDSRDRDGNTALLAAAEKLTTMFLTLQFLHQRGADITAINSKNENALHLAVMICEGDRVPTLNLAIKYLVGNGVDIEAVDNYGATPLIQACVKKTIDGVQALLENGAKVNAKSQRLSLGQTPLHIAYSRGCKDGIGKILLEYGADLEMENGQGKKPIDLIPPLRTGVGRVY